MRAIWLKSAALAAALWLMPGPAGVPAFAQSDTSRTEANADDVLSATEDGAMLRDPEALPSRDPSSDQDSAPDVAGTHSPADQPAEPDARTDAAAPPPEPTLAIDIDLGAQRMRVTEAGGKTYSWPVSSGAYGYPTPTGTFRPVWTSKMWYSRQYEYAPMPNSIFFHGGTAIHATTSVGMLGRPASHGCVRTLSIECRHALQDGR